VKKNRDSPRPEHQAEDVELACRQVEEHGLPVVPGNPGKHVVEAEQNPGGERPQPLETAADLARVDFLVGLVKRAACGGVPGGR
jgi:hypothetical protein